MLHSTELEWKSVCISPRCIWMYCLYLKSHFPILVFKLMRNRTNSVCGYFLYQMCVCNIVLQFVGIRWTMNVSVCVLKFFAFAANLTAEKDGVCSFSNEIFIDGAWHRFIIPIFERLHMYLLIDNRLVQSETTAMPAKCIESCPLYSETLWKFDFLKKLTISKKSTYDKYGLFEFTENTDDSFTNIDIHVLKKDHARFLGCQQMSK